jgi:cytochrome c
MKLLAALGVISAAMIAAPPAHAEGDAAAGKKVFNKCMACHDAKAEKNKVGPHLVGVIGRTLGAVEGYNYSAQMKELGAGGMVWDDANLTSYLRDPKVLVPDGKMAFPGLKEDADIANVIAYLAADPKP